jgi:excisionase family DNA binding protein
MQTEYIDLITIDELCDLLMIGRTTAYKLLQSGRLKAFKIGRVWKISRASVEQYIKESSNL